MGADCSRAFIVFVRPREPQSQDVFIIGASLPAIVLFECPDAKIVTWESGKGNP